MFSTHPRFLLFIMGLFMASFLIVDVSSAQDDLLGGEFAVTIGTQVGPFKTGAGPYVAGEIGIPLMVLAQDSIAHGRLLGVIHLGWAKTDDNLTFEPTVNAITPGLIPTQENVDLSTLSVLLGLKYKFLSHDIIQPYVMGGFGMYAMFNNSDPGELPGGIAPPPPELESRGFPTGQGDALLGLNGGVGVDFNVTHKIFIGAEARFNWVNEDNGAFGMFGGRLGFRF